MGEENQDVDSPKQFRKTLGVMVGAFLLGGIVVGLLSLVQAGNSEKACNEAMDVQVRSIQACGEDYRSCHIALNRTLTENNYTCFNVSIFPQPFQCPEGSNKSVCLRQGENYLGFDANETIPWDKLMATLEVCQKVKNSTNQSGGS